MFAEGGSGVGQLFHSLAQAEHSPSGVDPLGGVQAITPVHNDFGAHHLGQRIRIEVDELLPLGEQQHRVGAVGGLRTEVA